MSIAHTITHTSLADVASGVRNLVRRDTEVADGYDWLMNSMTEDSTDSEIVHHLAVHYADSFEKGLKAGSSRLSSIKGPLVIRKSTKMGKDLGERLGLLGHMDVAVEATLITLGVISEDMTSGDDYYHAFMKKYRAVEVERTHPMDMFGGSLGRLEDLFVQ